MNKQHFDGPTCPDCKVDYPHLCDTCFELHTTPFPKDILSPVPYHSIVITKITFPNFVEHYRLPIPEDALDKSYNSFQRRVKRFINLPYEKQTYQRFCKLYGKGIPPSKEYFQHYVTHPTA